MAILTKASNRLRGQNMYSLFIAVHFKIATKQKMILCVPSGLLLGSYWVEIVRIRERPRVL